MGWGVLDYPSAPREAGPESHCTHCAAGIYEERDAARCSAPGCRQEDLCCDCSLRCDICADAFCPAHAHIIERAMPSGQIYTDVICHACATRIATAIRKAA